MQRHIAPWFLLMALVTLTGCYTCDICDDCSEEADDAPLVYGHDSHGHNGHKIPHGQPGHDKTNCPHCGANPVVRPMPAKVVAPHPHVVAPDVKVMDAPLHSTGAKM